MADTINGTPELIGNGEESKDRELPKMSFLDHLDELRKRLIVSILALLAGFLVCWGFADRIFALIQAPLTKFLHGDKLAYTRLTAVLPLHEGGILRRHLRGRAGDPSAALAL